MIGVAALGGGLIHSNPAEAWAAARGVGGSAAVGGRGGWVNRYGGGGGWANRVGGGGWINGGGGGGWLNGGGGSAGWVNRYGGGGSWINRLTSLLPRQAVVPSEQRSAVDPSSTQNQPHLHI